jgi:two-component system, OmpR family, sensor histidine kinase KdpD
MTLGEFLIGKSSRLRSPGYDSTGSQVPKDRNAGLRRYIPGLSLIALIMLLGLGLGQELARLILPPIYFLVVLATGLREGRQAATAAALLGAAVFCVAFLLPDKNLGPYDAGAFISFGAMLSAGIVVGALAGSASEAAATAQQREADISALQSLTAALADATGQEAILAALASHLVKAFHRPVIVLLPDGGILVPRFCSPGLELNEHEAAAAAQAFSRNEETGRGTPNAPHARGYYIPLCTWRGTVGVLGILADDTQAPIAPENRHLLEAFANQAALSIARELLEEEAQQVEILRETDKLQKILLNSVSHNLRTPLATIIGSLTSLAETPRMLDRATQRELLDTALIEARRLNRLVGNLLDVARLESGTFKIKSELCDMQDVIGAALSQLGRMLANRPVPVHVPVDLPMISMDFVLISQVLVNLLENAHKYSPPGLPVEIAVEHAGKCLEVRVADRGKGIAENELPGIFDRFQRGRLSDNRKGLGLGLSISKGFVEAHNGRIWAEKRAGGGSIFAFSLPGTESHGDAKPDNERAAAANTGG